MVTTVRLPHRVEQALASYCVEKRRTKSEVIIELLEQRLLGADATDTSAFDNARAAGFIGCADAAANTAANAKKLVRQKLRAKHSR